MLRPARTVLPNCWLPAPPDASDLRLHRVQVGNGIKTGLTFLQEDAPSQE